MPDLVFWSSERWRVAQRPSLQSWLAQRERRRDFSIPRNYFFFWTVFFISVIRAFTSLATRLAGGGLPWGN